MSLLMQTAHNQVRIERKRNEAGEIPDAKRERCV